MIMLKFKRAPLAACLLLSLAAASLAQGEPASHGAKQRDGRTPSEKREVGALINKLGGRDADAASEAAEELAEVGQEAAHALTEALKSEKTQTRLYAALALSSVDPKRADALEVLRAIVRDRREHYLTRRHAAFALARTAAGVRALAEMLRDRDDEVRLSAAFAFEELSEGDSDDPAGPHAELRRVIPSIAEALRVERHGVVRDVLGETLGQLGPDARPRGEML
jgi:HEAT repeat protein